jgi:hypothetical protein
MSALTLSVMGVTQLQRQPLGVRRESRSSETAGRTPPQSFKIAIPRSNYFPSALDLHAFRLTVYSGGYSGSTRCTSRGFTRLSWPLAAA